MSFETIAAVLPLASMAFEGCICGIQIFSKACKIGIEGDAIRCKLEIETFRLLQWAESSGLHPYREGNERLNWTLVVDILKQEEQLLTTAAKLRNQYNLGSNETSQSTRNTTSSGQAKPSSPVFDLLSKLRPDIHNESARIIHKSNSPLSAIKWAIVGQSRAQQTVKEIAYFNDKLYQLLDDAVREQLQLTLTTMFRDVVSHSKNAQELRIVADVFHSQSLPSQASLEAALKLKQIRLSLGVDRRKDEQITNGTSSGIPRVNLRRLKQKKLEQLFPSSDSKLVLMKYAGSLVAVEWRTVGGGMDSELREQVQKLAVFLHLVEDPQLHSLVCRGYIEDEPESRFALVYSLPSGIEYVQAIETLSDFIIKISMPSLTWRIGLAIALAEAVLQLHTSGWLHKSIRSDNVAFLHSSGRQQPETVDPIPFIVGYEYARPDTITAITEEALWSLDTNIYRHPEARGTGRARFRKAFDLYGLGCVLIEIALWTALVDLQLESEGRVWRQAILQANDLGQDISLPSIDHALSETSLSAQIRFHAGNRYFEAVQACFSGVPSASAPTDPEDEQSLETEKYVVERLQRCVL